MKKFIGAIVAVATVLGVAAALTVGSVAVEVNDTAREVVSVDVPQAQAKLTLCTVYSGPSWGVRTKCFGANSLAPYLNQQRAVVGCESWDTVPYTRKAFYGWWVGVNVESYAQCGSAPGVIGWHRIYLQTYQLR